MVRRENLGNAPVDGQQEQAPASSFNDLEQPATQSTNTAPCFRPPFYQPTFDTPGQGVEPLDPGQPISTLSYDKDSETSQQDSDIDVVITPPPNLDEAFGESLVLKR
jgi:hypothetical protein